MGLEYLNGDLNIISRLSDRPSETEPGALSPQEFKAKFDEAANIIQRYINERLIPSIKAENVPFASEGTGVQGGTVLDAIKNLKTQIKQSQDGIVVDESVSEVKLTAEVRALLYRSTPVISKDSPAAEDDYKVGQIWLHTADGSARGSLIGMYIKTDNNTWKRYIYDILPVSGGGTGKNGFGSGTLLYGDGTNIAELSAPTEECKYLSYENEKPAWRNIAEIGDLIERIKTAYGNYDGDAEAREIELKDAEEQAIEPKVLFIVNDTLKLANMPTAKFNDHIHILTQGQKIERVLSPGISESSSSYVKECVKLEGSKLIIYHESNNQTTARCANLKGDKYLWTALY